MPEAALSVLYESTIKCGLLSASKHCLFCFPHMNKVELELYCSVGTSPFWVSYGPRDLPRFAASPPLSQPDSRRTAVTITLGLNDEFPLQGCSRASS